MTTEKKSKAETKKLLQEIEERVNDVKNGWDGCTHEDVLCLLAYIKTLEKRNATMKDGLEEIALVEDNEGRSKNAYEAKPFCEECNDWQGECCERIASKALGI